MRTKPSALFAVCRKAGPVFATAAFALHLAHASAQTHDASQLGKELTPSGADISASPGGIPAWKDPGDVGAGWSTGKLRKDSFRYRDDKPLFTINAGNADQYAAKLNPGQLALLKQVKDYQMPVYPTRRTCGIPDFVAQNTKKNVGFAKMAEDGVSISDAYVPGIPFPFAKTGAEAMWNAKLHYRGAGFEYRNMTTGVSPRQGSSDWLTVTADVSFYLPWGQKKGSTFADVNLMEGWTLQKYKAPAALAGQAAVFSSASGKQAEAFYYFPGQRRVRRLPAYAYDAPQIGYENQYTMDEPFVFSGSLDRFDWKLIGKKELIVPYNSFGLYDFTAKFEDVMLRDFVAPSHRRYEAHRVWVIEATVKSGMRHSAPKRVFYIDEDSWLLVGAVDYDAQGNVWKVREGHVIPVYETGACESLAFVQHNLMEGRYLVDGSPVGAGSDIAWIVDPAGKPNMRPDYYTAENLRAMSER